MKLAFILDPLDRLDPSGDTSIALIEAAEQLGHGTWVAEPGTLSLRRSRAHAELRRIHVQSAGMDGPRWAHRRSWYTLEDPAGPMPLDSMDAIFIRTDPPFDRDYLWATWILDFVDRSTTTLINDPRGIRDANEKLFALRFPDLIPSTIVSADLEEILDFVRDHRRTVAKPVDGHAGHGVVQLRTDDDNLRSLIELATERGRKPTVVQAWLDEAATGNKRLLLWDGDLLGAVNRPVEPGDFRTGAPNASTDLTSRERAIVARIGPDLRRSGLRFVGLDTIGGYLIEVNVTSPGGLRQAVGLGLPEIARDLIRALDATRPSVVAANAGFLAIAESVGMALNVCGH
jgi:glutathione synthase